MKEISWYSDENGLLQGARIHDAAVLAVAYSGLGSLSLDFRRVAGQRVRLDLSEVTELTINELWDNAILSDVFIWKVRQVPEVTWSIPDGGWNALFKNRLPLLEARTAVQAIMLRRPEPMLFVAGCSYGGLLAAVCKALHVSEEL